jgi:hypothetical protein
LVQLIPSPLAPSVLRFELRSLYLLGRHATTWAIPQALEILSAPRLLARSSYTFGADAPFDLHLAWSPKSLLKTCLCLLPLDWQVRLDYDEPPTSQAFGWGGGFCSQFAQSVALGPPHGLEEWPLGWGPRVWCRTGTSTSSLYFWAFKGALKLMLHEIHSKLVPVTEVSFVFFESFSSFKYSTWSLQPESGALLRYPIKRRWGLHYLSGVSGWAWPSPVSPLDGAVASHSSWVEKGGGDLLLWRPLVVRTLIDKVIS